MKDLKLNAGGDLDLSSGDAKIIDNLSQAITIRLRWNRGEWPINKEYGVPYFENVLGQKFGNALIEADIVNELNNVTGIAQINSLEVVRDKQRKLKVSFSVTGENGVETGDVVI